VLVDDILGSAVSMAAVAPAVDEITALLRQRHHIRREQDDDFNVRCPDEVLGLAGPATSPDCLSAGSPFFDAELHPVIVQTDS
jgi:hypothetical protein